MKYDLIAKLEALLKEAEENLCWAIRSGNSNEMALCYVARQTIVKELCQVV